MKEKASIILEEIFENAAGQEDPVSIWLAVHIPLLIEDCGSDSLFMREKLDLACIMMKWEFGEENIAELSVLEDCRDLFMDYPSLESSDFMVFLKRSQESLGHLHSREEIRNFTNLKERLKDFRILLSTLINKMLKRKYEKTEDIQEDLKALLDEFFQMRHFLRSKPTFKKSAMLRGGLEKTRNLLYGAAKEFESSRR